MVFRTLFLISVLFFSDQSYAFSLDEDILPNDLESRAVKLFKVTRCMICSGESLYDSQSAFAREMRGLIRKDILKGMDDGEILSSLRERYGMQILADTPYERDTYMLWVVPAFIAAGLCFAMFYKLFLVRKNSM